MQSVQPPPTGPLHPSSNLRDEDKRLPSILSESGSGMNSDFCPPAVNTHVEPSDSTNTPFPESDLKQFSKPDSTVLLNQTMEITLSDPAEIVTVESKVRKMGHPSRAKAKKKNNKQTCGSDKADKQVKDGTHSRKSQVEKINAEEPTLKDRTPEEILQLSKSQSLNILNSDLPKKSNKRSKIKLKFQQAQDPEVCDVVSLKLDGDFTDPAAHWSNICVSRTSLPGGDGAEEAKSNITCRRSKDRGKAMSVSRKTFVNWPFLMGEPDGHFEVVEKDHDTEPGSMVNGHQIRRQTFIISDHSSPKTASPAASRTTSFSSQSDACPTQRLQSRRESSSHSNQDSAVPTVHPNPRKNSRHKKKPFDKTEAMQKRQRICEKEKEREGRCLGNEKLRCSEKAQFAVDNINNANIESEMVGRSLSDRGEEAGSSEQFYGMDMLKQQLPSEPRSRRNNFVIHQLDDPLDSRRSVPSDGSSRTMKTRHELENFGDMLMDEGPPWLNTEVPLTDTEEASSFSTPRRKTTDGASLDLESATETPPGG